MLNGKNRHSGPGPLCASYAHVLPVLDDLADAHLATEVRAHLADCAWCHAQRTTYDRFDGALRLYFAPDAMPILSDSVMRSLMQEIHDEAGTIPPPAKSIPDDDPLELTVSPLPIPPHPPHTSSHFLGVTTGAAAIAAVLVISLLAGLIFLSHGRPQSATGQHTTTTPAVEPGSEVTLTAVDMSSPADGWAMGRQRAASANGGSSDDPAYVLHYTGGRWMHVQTSIRAWITAIKMLSPTDGWAIGSSVYRYDGVSWRKVTLPANGQLNAIAVVSPTNIWIASGGASGGHATILHYDGSHWTQQDTPALLDFFTINGLSMVSASEGWAVGSAMLDGSKGWYPPTGAVLHYINGAWQLTQTFPGDDLHSVSMGSAADGWAGGNRVALSKTGRQTLSNPPIETNYPKLWHYTGNRWTEVDASQSAALPATGQITSISMFSTTQGWIFADDGTPPFGTPPFDQSTQSPAIYPDVFHLEQGRWVQVKTPTVQQRRGAEMLQTVFLSPDEFWSVGDAEWWTGIPSGMGDGYRPTVTPLIVHYKNGSWTIVQS
jgi:hypothetical protein